MDRIDPQALRNLRKAKRWSLKTLAEKSKTDKQTIWRLENGTQGKTRQRTIEQLARALGVAEGVLTGAAPAPEVRPESEPSVSKQQLNVRLGNAPRNQLSLVARRYNRTPSEIVALAPYLFTCAAEASLRQRKERVDELEHDLMQVWRKGKDIRHLFPHVTTFTHSEEVMEAERESIKRRDLFAEQVEANLFDPMISFNRESENPFASYLRGLAAQAGDVASFEGWDGDFPPEYRVCPDQAAELVGGDRERADEILGGLVALNEMPKEIRQIEKTKERAEWVRQKAEEYRAQGELLLADLDALLDEEGKTKS